MSTVPFKAAVAEIAEAASLSHSAVIARIYDGRIALRTQPDPINKTWRVVEVGEVRAAIARLRRHDETWIPFGVAIVEAAGINGTTVKTALSRFYRRRPDVETYRVRHRRSDIRRSQLQQLAEQLA